MLAVKGVRVSPRVLLFMGICLAAGMIWTGAAVLKAGRNPDPLLPPAPSATVISPNSPSPPVSNAAARRRDPFVPLLVAPNSGQPSAYGQPSPAGTGDRAWQLTGVVESGGKYAAVIDFGTDSKVVRVGDVIKDCTVVSIERGAVNLQGPNGPIILLLKR